MAKTGKTVTRLEDWEVVGRGSPVYLRGIRTDTNSFCVTDWQDDSGLNFYEGQEVMSFGEKLELGRRKSLT